MESEVVWLTELIETSRICLGEKKSSEEYDKLIFQLEGRLKREKNSLKTPQRREEDRIVVVNEDGKVIESWNVEIKESIQDEGRTLKLFVKKKVNDANHDESEGVKK